MQNFKIFLIFIIFIFVNSCGFKKFNSISNNDFKINFIEIVGDRKISTQIKNNIAIYSKNDSKLIFDIKIKVNDNKIGKIKDSTGSVIRYTSNLSADVKITEVKTNLTFNKTFISNSDYDVLSNHVDTLRNEKRSQTDNVNYVSEEIVKYIKLLNIN